MTSLSCISLSSSDTSASRSRTPTSFMSSSTIPGIGALTGRALKALGTGELRVIENLVIHQRLVIIRFYLPHEDVDEESIRKIDQMYTDLLELSRPGFYSEAIRRRSVDIIVQRVLNRQTRRLMHALVKWPQIEVELFISQFLNTRFRDHSYPRRVSIPIMSALLSGSEWHISPLLEFVSNLAAMNESTCHFLLEAGLLDMVLGACLRGSLLFASSVSNLANYNRMLAACTSSFPATKLIISRHPLCGLWPTTSPFFMRQVPAVTTTLALDRQAAWRKVDGRTMMGRIEEIWVFLSWRRVYEFQPLDHHMDVCIDLLELTRIGIHNPEITTRASKCLDFFVQGGDTYEGIYRSCCDALSVDPVLL